MRFDDVYPSSYLKASDCEDGDLALTIEAVRTETLGQGKDAEVKPVASFHETDKTFVVNKTNWKTIEKLYGPDSDDWVGKRIALFATEVPFGQEMVMAIRVRLKAPKGKATALAATPRPPGPGPELTTAPPADDGDGDDDIPF